MLVCLIPVVIITLWNKGLIGKFISCVIFLCVCRSFLFFFPSIKGIEQTTEIEYDITDLSAAYDSGRKRTVTDYIVIHHTAMPSTQKTSILNIASIHMKEHNWSSIAYQYLIMNGEIYKLHDDDDIAPHTLGHNNNSIAICIHGNYSTENLSESDRKKLVWLVMKLQDKYKIDASKVVKHGELNATECCGNNININDIRKCLKNY